MRKFSGPQLCFLAALVVSLVSPSLVQGERSHLVKEGQTLSAIAQHYRVTVASIAAANRLGRGSMLRPGQMLRIPEPGVIYVQAGQNLSKIAHRHHVSVADLARLNRMRPGDTLREGQRLILPGYEAARASAKSARRWGSPKHPGVGTFHRIWSDERKRMRLIDRRGRVSPAARNQLRHLLRPKNSKRRKAPHPRLVRLLALVSDHFGGRPIDIVSGYRLPGGNTKRSSRHVRGNAIDFRVRGVPLQALRDYCRKFSNVGVGFYPNSRFVHLDVRNTNAFWVDWSKPGQPPMLKRPTPRRNNDGSTDDAHGDDAHGDDAHGGDGHGEHDDEAH